MTIPRHNLTQPRTISTKNGWKSFLLGTLTKSAKTSVVQTVDPNRTRLKPQLLKYFSLYLPAL